MPGDVSDRRLEIQAGPLRFGSIGLGEDE